MASPRARAALLLPALLLAAFAAQARVNLPQIRRTVPLPGEAVRALQAGLTSKASTDELPPSVEELFLKALPQDFREACGAMIAHWGEIARGSAEWKVRLLHQGDHSMWLAFRCRSRTPEYVDDYDERPALLRLDTGQLQFFPLAPDSENDSTLYRLEFSQVVPLEGRLGFAFKVAEPAGNPCCDGPESRSGETWRIFAETPQGVAELLSIVTARDDASHSDDPEVDSETTYRAEITLERDANQRVTAVLTAFREETKEFREEGESPTPQTVNRRSGTLHYRWNPESLLFEEVK